MALSLRTDDRRWLYGCTVVRLSVGKRRQANIDGSAITAEIKASLANASETSAASINIKAIEGGVVQLSGFAKSQREKDHAGELAYSIKGVSEVRSSLTVQKQSTHPIWATIRAANMPYSVEVHRRFAMGMTCEIATA